MNAQTFEFLSKMTMKTLGAQPKPGAVKTAVPLVTIYGIASSFKIGTSNYGEFTKFSGDFRAFRASDNEEFRSGTLLLPGSLPDMLRSAVQQAGDSGVQFGVLIGVKPADVPIGYEYTVKPIINTDAADPLAALHEQVLKALPAPTADTHSETTAHKAVAKKGNK